MTPITTVLRVAAVACAALAVLLAVLVHPALFLGNGGGWISFHAWYATGQWWSARLAAAALALFAVAAFGDPAGVGPRGLWLAPVSAIAVLVHFVVATLPHPAAASRWVAGELGIAAWLRAERAQRAQRGEVVHSSASSTPETTMAAFDGAWRAPDGTAYRFHADRVEWRGPHGAGVLSHAACGDPWELTYETMSPAAVLAMPVPWTPAERARLGAWPRQSTIPVAAVWCPGAGSPVFVRIDADTLWMRRGAEAGMEAAAAATPLARVSGG